MCIISQLHEITSSHLLLYMRDLEYSNIAIASLRTQTVTTQEIHSAATSHPTSHNRH